MKNFYKLVLSMLVCVSGMMSQTIQLNQSFTAPFNFAANGWFIQNNSSPIGPSTWTQGTGTVFPAFSGGVNDYAAVNFNSQGASVGDIYNFLVTPTVSLMNGGILQFATRTSTNPTNYPDRLVLLMSFGTGTGNIGPNVGDNGTFTQYMLDVNPNLTSSGYPSAWTVYSVTLGSISGTVTGRFAFLYDVPDGGPNGSNSDYIGLDNVLYTTAPPCAVPNVSLSTPNSLTICSGSSVSIAAFGATNYTWLPGGSNASSITVNPTSTTIYTLAAKNPTGCVAYQTITVSIGPPPTVITTTVLNVCPGSNATLTASGASTYSWSNGATGSINIVTVNSNTTFVVTGSNGPGCSDTETITITSNPFLIVSNTSLTACPNQPTILGASGALTYNWSNGATTPSIVITPTANVSYTVTGNDGTCNESKVFNVVIDPNIFAPSFTTCAGTSATLIASGATSYSWNTGATSAMIIVTPTANTVYTITGTSGSCSQSKTVSVTLGANLSVNCTQTCVGTSLLLSAYGASSYTWQPINDFNASVIVTPTAATIYTLSGKSGTCSGSRTIQVTFCASVEELELVNEAIRVYPNPFSNEITIKDAYGDVRMINMFGQLILTAKVEEKVVISTEELTPGIYFLIVTNPKTIERKIIKVIKN